MRLAFLLIVASGLLSTPVLGDDQPCGPRFVVTFQDSDPDVFTIENKSGEGWTLVGLSIVLVGSAGNLIFDTVAGGLGSGSPSAFFSKLDSPVKLIDARGADDGGRAVSLAFEAFEPGRTFDFYTDVDDRLPQSSLGQPHVEGSEFRGASAYGVFRGLANEPVRIEAIFDDNAQADTGSGGCV